MENSEELMLGLTVKWYPKALTQMQPMVAMIIRVHNESCVDLSVWRENGEQVFVDASYHRDSTDSLIDSAGRPLEHVKHSGCWELTEASKVIHAMGMPAKPKKEKELAKS